MPLTACGLLRPRWRMTWLAARHEGDLPPDLACLADVDISPVTLARRKLWRLVKTLAGVVGGALVGFVFLLFLAR